MTAIPSTTVNIQHSKHCPRGGQVKITISGQNYCISGQLYHCLGQNYDVRNVLTECTKLNVLLKCMIILSKLQALLLLTSGMGNPNILSFSESCGSPVITV